ncbi:MAG: histidine phosphatase family protein [Lentisphaeria bacterium]|nr:histidine phosphatase family protein [Lentisphaeria bacterium]
MGNMTEIYFVRHGEIDANVTRTIQGQNDVPLNAKGLEQAASVGKRLKERHFDVIYSSDLKRAAVTAQHIANGREIIYTEKLREWCVGIWQGLPLEEVKKLYPEDFAAYAAGLMSFSPAGGESAGEFCSRAAEFITGIAEKHPGKRVLCVSHGGFLRAVLKKVNDLDIYPNYAVADNTCICCFKTGDNGKSWFLVKWNDTAHLESDGIGCGGW